MNTFMKNLTDATNYTNTTNGALAYKSTASAVYDLFAFGGACRRKEDNDIILMFKNALEEDKALALKCLFYLRDILGGQGERRFFRVCFQWLANNDKEAAIRNLIHIAEFGRYDDLYTLLNTTKITIAAAASPNHNGKLP